MAWSKLSVGLVATSGLLLSGVVTACSDEAEPIKAGPSSAGSPATAGGSPPSGGSAPIGGTSTGGSAGAQAGSTGGATGFPPVGDKCGPNTTKKDGLCFCQPASLDACASGCGDFQTDAERCGNCDTRCEATQACNAGKCTATPKALVAAAATCDIKLAVAGGTLYWTDKVGGTLHSVATTGGTPKSLVTAQMAPSQVAVNGSSLYWLASGTKQIMTATLAGATPTEVVKSASDAIGGFTFRRTARPCTSRPAPRSARPAPHPAATSARSAMKRAESRAPWRCRATCWPSPLI